MRFHQTTLDNGLQVIAELNEARIRLRLVSSSRPAAETSPASWRASRISSST